jgi:hypothetical protein
MFYGFCGVSKFPKFAPISQILSPLTNPKVTKASLHPTFSISIYAFAWY